VNIMCARAHTFGQTCDQIYERDPALDLISSATCRFACTHTHIHIMRPIGARRFNEAQIMRAANDGFAALLIRFRLTQFNLHLFGARRPRDLAQKIGAHRRLSLLIRSCCGIFQSQKGLAFIFCPSLGLLILNELSN